MKKNKQSKPKAEQETKPEAKQKGFFILLGDCEVKFEGTKDECIKFFQKLPCPITFTLLDVKGAYNIWREFGKQEVYIREVKKQ